MLFRLIAFNGRFIHSCLALFYVRGGLEQNLPDCVTQVSQYTINDPYYTTLRQIGSGNPQALFFSVYIWNNIYIKRLLGNLAKLLPHTPKILGGPEAETLARSLAVDVRKSCTIVKGEIEGVSQAFYRDLTKSRLLKEYDCAKVSSFKSPYRKEDFAGPLKNRNIYYESSRGCPFGCTYCLSAAEKGVRHLPLSQVCDEIEHILRCKPKVIRFVDRTFNDLPERALDIWRFLLEQPGGTLFHFEMAPDRFTEDLFQFLEQVEPGRFQFELGIQSTNPQTLAAINRKCNLPKAAENIRRLAALDSIHTHLDLILGLPFEDHKTFSRSFADVFMLGPHYIQMGLLKVLPGTPISRAIEEFGMLACEKPPYEILANRWLTTDEVEELFWFGKCVEAFYNNRFFRSFWEYLSKKEEDIFVFFQELQKLCLQKGFFDRAKTQELLSSFLLEAISNRPDSALLKELLIFDWLRCGHHFLPPHLDKEPIARHRKKLWQQQPLKLQGFYDYKSRDEFFKQGVFTLFSEELLQQVGLTAAGKDAYVCFQAQREETVFRLNRFLLIPASVQGVQA
ncbi:MAG: DUF4080 domain-containing protein [Deltaproteobacteria bacterium]|jgi:hypothetical protein|nr:DUF4080 domain-containing protein [Deltaproteobacteria bacterium]